MTLRNKIFLLGLIAIAGMGLALWQQYAGFADQFRAVAAISRNTKAVGDLSRAVHELQKERGLTTIALSGRDNMAIAAQHDLSSAAIVRLADAGSGIADLDSRLARLRAAVANGTITPLAARDGYNTLLQNLIDEMARLGREPESAIAKEDVSAHIQLVACKEYLGQIRATLGFWIEDGRNDYMAFRELIRLKGLYDEALRKFRLEATPALSEVLDAQFSGHEVQSTMKVVTLATVTGKRPTGIDAPTWWATATAAIDRLKTVEDKSLEVVGRKADDRLAELQRRMIAGILMTVAAGLVVLALTVSAIISLLRALGRVLTSMEHIAASQDFHSRIPADTQDEIGRISRSFNHLLDIAERLLKEKDFLATTDPLTGIYNRLQFAKVCTEEAERKRRHYAPMALIIFDIDHFKRINDTYGHNVGDDVLKALAKRVLDETRSTDFFGRWGGEEFVLLLREEGCDAAMVTAEKLRHLIVDTEFPTVGKLTCSFGVAAWNPDDTEASLVARADSALYASKDGGRNRVTCEQGNAGSCGERSTCRP